RRPLLIKPGSTGSGHGYARLKQGWHFSKNPKLPIILNIKQLADHPFKISS
ncbi:MAG: hypothetical protein ACI9TH_003471, partial [Kiritimatiellia bacterium]